MKFKVKHKTEGWTGTMELEDFQERATSSHRVYFTISGTIHQDAYDADGKYREDPDVSFLNELEIEYLDEQQKDKENTE